ncbi:MAG: CAP domain-containing protein [Candidatus Limnocylindrales bacterium]
MPTSTRRLVSLTLSLAVGLATAGLSAGPAAAASLPPFDVTTLALARADLTTLVNDQRVAHGLVALQVASTAAAMAVSRAQSMASMDALSHAGPDGQTTFDAIRASGMTWFGAGEVIAYNTNPGEPESTNRAVADWLASPTHASILLSGDYNYVGFAAAVSGTGNRYYAGVFLKLPDRTAGWARVGQVTRTILDASNSRVTVRWSGGDTRLQVLTAGLRDFQIQRRLAGGTWQSAGTTTHTSLSIMLVRGRSYEFRVRSRDKAGNRSAWSSVSVRT